MKFTHQYKLKKDLPNYKKGWKLGWCGREEKFYPYQFSRFDKEKEDICLDYKHQGYDINEIKDKEWFEPIGKEKDYIPKFPSIDRIEDFVCLDFECRLIDDVDECRCMNKLFSDKKFKKDLYNFVKDKYNNYFNFN